MDVLDVVDDGTEGLECEAFEEDARRREEERESDLPLHLHEEVCDSLEAELGIHLVGL